MSSMHATRKGDRTLVGSGSPWEPVVAYSRALRVGDRVLVAGTTAVDANGEVVDSRNSSKVAQVSHKVLAGRNPVPVHL